MTVEIYPNVTGAGATDYQSKRYSVTVNGTPTWVWGVERTAAVGIWGAVPVEHSWVKIGTTETVEFRITRKDPGTGTPIPITSFRVAPGARRGVSAALQGGVLVVTCPANRRVRVETNGDRAHAIGLFADPLAPAKPVGSQNWVTLGQPTTIAANQKVFIPAGSVHTVPGAVNSNREIVLNSGAEVYIEGGAVLIGSFKLATGPTTGSSNCVVNGPGVHSGAYVAYPYVQGLPTIQDMMTYGMYHVPEGAVATALNNRVEGVTITLAPFYVFGNPSVWQLKNAHMINPWFGNTDGANLKAKDPNDARIQMSGCYLFAGDDCVHFTSANAAITIEDCFILTSNGGCLHGGYWPQPFSVQPVTITRCDVMSFSLVYSNDATHPGGVVRLWIDGSANARFEGRYNVTMDIDVYGPVAQRLFAVENTPYPVQFWGGAAQEQCGNAALWWIKVWSEETPVNKSRFGGKDRMNTPCGFYWEEPRVGGLQISASNFSDFADMTTAKAQTLYHFYVDGKILVTQVDIVNLALARIGDPAKVLSLVPLDGSVQADLGAKFLPQAIELVLGRHAWAFATKRSTLVEVTGGGNDQFPYCYEVPGGMLRLLAVLPEGITDVTQTLPPSDYAVEWDGAALRVYTTQPAATLVYTTYDIDINAWPPEFKEAVVLRLASMLLGPMKKGDQSLAQQYVQLSEYEASRGAMFDATLRRTPNEHKVSWMEARN